MANRASVLPRVLGGVAAVAALLAYGLGLFLIPQVLDWAFDQGGKAPLLIAVIGAAFTIGVYVGVEKLASKALAR